MQQNEADEIAEMLAHEPELTDEDILDAMQHIPGYLDISTEDFRILYHLAWRHAAARLLAGRKGPQGSNDANDAKGEAG